MQSQGHRANMRKPEGEQYSKKEGRIMKPYRSILLVVVLAGFVGACILGAPAVSAQEKPKDYPSKPVELVVAHGAGGGTDVFTRAIGIPMRRSLGVPLVINNMPGAAGCIGTKYVGEQAADGYTILANSADIVITDAFNRCQTTRNDLTPIARVQHDQSLLWVKSDSPFKTIQDVVNDAKANPGKQKWGITTPAGYDECLVGSFQKAAGIKVVNVPFTSASQTLAALLGGHVEIMHEEAGPVISLYEAGQIRPLVIMTEERIAILKDTPTARELGWDVTIGIWRGLFVKKGTPPEIVKYLEAVVQKAMKNDVYKAVEKQMLLDLRPGYLPGAEFAKFMDEEYELYKGILKELGHIK